MTGWEIKSWLIRGTVCVYVCMHEGEDEDEDEDGVEDGRTRVTSHHVTFRT